MATYLAVAAACEAVVGLLRRAYQPALFGGTTLSFDVYNSSDFSNAAANHAGVSLFLYRVVVNGVHRTPRLPGNPAKTKLPIELHFLLTAWGGTASLQNTIIGWMMRTLEDYPTMDTAMLHSVWPGVFKNGESVEIAPAELSTEDLFRIWEVILPDSKASYRLSVPYVARILYLESDGGEAPPLVRTRQFDAGNLAEGVE